VWWRSPYAPAQLRAALRRAEEGERFRYLETLAQLAAPPCRSGDEAR
jgi:hypothetical protein